MAMTFAGLVPPIFAQRGMMPDFGFWRLAAYGFLALVALVLLIWMSSRGPGAT
jgi:hypothetical protein